MSWPPRLSDFYSLFAKEPADSRGTASFNGPTPAIAQTIRPTPDTVNVASIALDAIGKRDEQVRVRLDEMVSRLEDLKSLSEDFSSLIQPLSEISHELPKAAMRVVDLETMLAHEREQALLARSQAGHLEEKLALASDQGAIALERATQLDALLRTREAELREEQLRSQERVLALENVERQLAAANENIVALTGENKAVRLEVQAIDEELGRAEHELVQKRSRLDVLEREVLRAQHLSQDQGIRLSDATGRVRELEETLAAERGRVRDLEAQISVETASHAKVLAGHEAEASAFRIERANLQLKLEAASNRASSLDQVLDGVRNQLREKDSEARIADRAMKQATIERDVAERRVESAQAEFARQTDRLVEVQRLLSDTDARADMLTKALAAKDLSLEQAMARIASVSDRLDQTNARLETERANWEADKRNLAEELQRERSERVMAQGALNIARESRNALQRQHDAGRRAQRGPAAAAPEPALEPHQDGPESGSVESNVRPFAPDAARRKPGAPSSPQQEVNP
jgi:crescentin